MTKTLFYALEDFEYAVRCNCQCCVTDAEATTDAQVNEARQKALDAALAEHDAAVAAALDKAAEFFRQKAENLRNGPTAPWQAEAIAQFEYASNICSHMQPDALAEHDAKVRADALREARDKISGEVFAMPNGTTMDRSYNLAVKDCLAVLEALIEGEA